MLTNVHKSLFRNGEENEKMARNPHADPDHHQKLATLEGHPADYAVARWPSVRLSVCHTPVLCLNGYTYPQSFFTVG